jgi:hypothetical protein
VEPVEPVNASQAHVRLWCVPKFEDEYCLGVNIIERCRCDWHNVFWDTSVLT